MSEHSEFATLSTVLRAAANSGTTMEDFSRAMQAAYEQVPRLTERITLGSDPLFACHRCNDIGTVPDWANWQEQAWLWQRYRPVPHIPCPDCSDRSAPCTRPAVR